MYLVDSFDFNLTRFRFCFPYLSDPLGRTRSHDVMNGSQRAEKRTRRTFLRMRSERVRA